MPNYLTQLKQAEQQLSRLFQTMPDLPLTFDHQLQTYFPHLPADSCTDLLYITYKAPHEPGQKDRLISYTLSTLIKRSILSTNVPAYDQGETHVYNRAYTLDEQSIVQGLSIGSVEAFVTHLIHNLEQCVKNALADFWKTSYIGLDNRTPQDWLSMLVKNLISAEAEQRRLDKTLSAAGYGAVKQILTLPALEARVNNQTSQPLSVYGVGLIGPFSSLDTPLQGLLVIADPRLTKLDDTLPGLSPTTKPPLLLDVNKVVLYIPGSGLEEFESLHALSMELESRLADEYQVEALLNCTLLKDRERAQSLYSIGYREITADVFNTYTTELIDKQKQNLAYAWKTARDQNIHYDLEALSLLVEQSLGASISLNPTGIIQARYTRLLESQLPTWLTAAPEESKQQWRQAVAHLKKERLASQTTETTPLLENDQQSTLLGYARARLIQQIKSDHQLDVDPDHIFVSTTIALNTSPGVYPLGNTGYIAGVSVHRTGPTITYKTTRRSLSELALENVGLLDLNFALTARVHDAQGKQHPTLTTAYLKALVRRLDIGEAYKSLLYKTLADPESQQVMWRKERYVAVTAAQMRLDILEAKLAGYLSLEEATWAETALKYPVEGTRPAVNDKSVKVHLLTLREHPMPGILAITTYSPSRLLCYTPNAPDKVWFRAVNTLDELALELSKKKLHGYVMQHVSSAEKPYIKHSLNKGLKAPSLGLNVISANFLQTAYDEEVSFALNNADEQSTSTFEANVQTAKDVALTFIDTISFVLPLKILLPLALSRFIYSLAEGFDALKRDDKNEAMLFFLDSISHLTDGASDFAGSAVFGGSIRQRRQVPQQNLNPKAASTKSTANMKLRKSDRYGSGIYELTEAGGGKTRYYLQDEQGNLYLGQYDNLSESWRIIDERQPNAIQSIPVAQISAGRWGASPTTRRASLSLQELIQRASVNVNLSERTPDANGIYKVDSLHYIQQDGVVFEVQHGWLGRTLYLNMPGTSRGNQNTYKVRRHAERGDWEVKRRQSDNTKQWEPLTLQPSRRPSIPDEPPVVTYSDYDVSPEHINAVKEMIGYREADFRNHFYPNNPKFEAARIHLLNLQKKMLMDAQEFLNTRIFLPRPKLPRISARASQERIFNTLYDAYQGVVIAESHYASSSKKIILDNMAYLARKDVKVLYLEHLQTDLHQPYLDDLFKTGHMHPDLVDFLNDQDFGHHVNQLTPYTFSRLVRETYTHGIHIKALDCVASYNLKGLVGIASKSIRHEILSYGGAKIIRKTTPFGEGQKWIALTGNTHANTFKGVAGLSELEGAVGLRVEDAPPRTGRGIRPDIGLVDLSPAKIYDYACLKNDLVLDIELPYAIPHRPPRTQDQLSAALPTAGMYTLDNDPLLGPMIIHRSRIGEILRTPILFAPDGTLHIEREVWPSVHLKPYSNLTDMIYDLNAIRMERL